jgi:hypothetical protein
VAVCGDGDHFHSGILVRIYCQNSRSGVASGLFEGFSLALFSNVCARAATAFWSELAIVAVIGLGNRCSRTTVMRSDLLRK